MFHINDNEEIKPCKAKVADCPFEKHFDNKEDSYAYIAETNTLLPRITSDESLIRNFIKKNSDLYEIGDLVGSENIYHKAKLLMYAKNASRFPYKKSIDDLTSEESARIRSKAKSMNLQYEAAAQVAVSSPAGWALTVMPNVEKQVYQETALFNFLKQELKNHSVNNLSGGGTNAFYLVDGEIKTGLKSKPKSSIKSLDFHIKSPKSNDIYIVAKYTVGEGGGQDHQYQDARSTLEEMTRDSDSKLALILDGDYYQKRGEKKTEPVLKCCEKMS